MNPFDVFTTYISWGSGGKNRPVLVRVVNEESIFVYQITTQYENKSEAIKAKYFKINDWAQAGLDMQSYVDTGTVLKLPMSTISGKVKIGELSTADKQRLIEFIMR